MQRSRAAPQRLYAAAARSDRRRETLPGSRALHRASRCRPRHRAPGRSWSGGRTAARHDLPTDPRRGAAGRVAVFALRGRHVHLEAVAEAEQRFGAIPVVYEAVEWREQRGPIGHRGVAHVRVRLPAASARAGLRAPGSAARRAAAPPRAGARPRSPGTSARRDPRAVDRFAGRPRPPPRRRRSNSTSGDRRPPVPAVLAAALRRAVPARARAAARGARALSGGTAGRPRSASASLDSPLPCVGGTTAHPHPGADQRQRFDRPDEGVPFEELALDPQQPLELARIERPQTAPQHELSAASPPWRSGRAGGSRVPGPFSAPPEPIVEQLRANGDAPRLLLCDLPVRETARTRLSAAPTCSPGATASAPLGWAGARLRRGGDFAEQPRGDVVDEAAGRFVGGAGTASGESGRATAGRRPPRPLNDSMANDGAFSGRLLQLRPEAVVGDRLQAAVGGMEPGRSPAFPGGVGRS